MQHGARTATPTQVTPAIFTQRGLHECMDMLLSSAFMTHHVTLNVELQPSFPQITELMALNKPKQAQAHSEILKIDVLAILDLLCCFVAL